MVFNMYSQITTMGKYKKKTLNVFLDSSFVTRKSDENTNEFKIAANPDRNFSLAIYEV